MKELDQRIRAKIPGEDTEIEIRRTLCDICTPQMHCGLDVYVKDGIVLKVEGSPEHPVNRGFLCTKGAANRQYLYRKDRILTPLRRVGPVGQETLSRSPGTRRSARYAAVSTAPKNSSEPTA